MTKEGQYKIPVILHLKRVAHELWVGVIAFLTFLIASIATTVANGIDGDGIWAMWALCGVSLAVLTYAGIWTFRNKEVWYETHGLRVVFQDHNWFVPPKVFEGFLIREVFEPFRRIAEARGINPEHLLYKKRIIFTKEKPQVLVLQDDGTVKRQQVIGATYPIDGYSLVLASHVLSSGGAGWELKLHACHVLYPGRSEAEDKAWMEKEGII